MAQLTTNSGGIYRGGAFPMGLAYADFSTVQVVGNIVKVYRSGNSLVFELPLATTTIDGESFETVEALVAKLLSFKFGGGDGSNNPGVTALQWSDASTMAEALKLARRDGYGSIVIPLAVEQDHAVPLSQLNALLQGKVDKEEGKALSSNDFSDDYRNKLDNVEDPLFLGSFADLQSLQDLTGERKSGQYAYVQGLDEGVDVVLTYQWVVANQDWELLRGASNSETPMTVKQKYESNANTNAFTDAEKAKLAGIAEGAQVNQPVEQTIPTLDQVVKRNGFTNSSFHLSKDGKRVGLEDVPGIGAAFSSDQNDNSGIMHFDGLKWVILSNIGGNNNLILDILGRANVKDPTEVDNIANKRYVDAEIAKIPTGGTGGDSTLVVQQVNTALSQYIIVDLPADAPDLLRFELFCPDTREPSYISMRFNNNSTSIYKHVLQSVNNTNYTMIRNYSQNQMRVLASPNGAVVGRYNVRIEGTLTNVAGQVKIANGTAYLAGTTPADAPDINNFWGSAHLEAITNAKLTQLQFVAMASGGGARFPAGSVLKVYGIK